MVASAHRSGGYALRYRWRYEPSPEPEGRKVTFMQSQAVEEDDEGAEEGAGT